MQGFFQKKQRQDPSEEKIAPKDKILGYCVNIGINQGDEGGKEDNGGDNQGALLPMNQLFATLGGASQQDPQ